MSQVTTSAPEEIKIIILQFICREEGGREREKERERGRKREREGEREREKERERERERGAVHH